MRVLWLIHMTLIDPEIFLVEPNYSYYRDLISILW
jgi:hypothetical protein